MSTSAKALYILERIKRESAEHLASPLWIIVQIVKIARRLPHANKEDLFTSVWFTLETIAKGPDGVSNTADDVIPAATIEAFKNLMKGPASLMVSEVVNATAASMDTKKATPMWCKLALAAVGCCVSTALYAYLTKLYPGTEL